ncbi:MAG: hypothetical protein HWN67_22855 [Candidatus Helarchaeota archaeon]|nr:hypothetical protein [Candidatus Helarchaeota archaeon]
MATFKELKEDLEKKLVDFKEDYDNKVKEAKEEFKRDLKELQRTCKHPKVSVLIKGGSQKKEKVCKICNAKVKKAKLTIHMP